MSDDRYNILLGFTSTIILVSYFVFFISFSTFSIVFFSDLVIFSSNLHFTIILHLNLFFILSIGAGNGLYNSIFKSSRFIFYFMLSYIFFETFTISFLFSLEMPTSIISQKGGYLNCFLSIISVL